MKTSDARLIGELRTKLTKAREQLASMKGKATALDGMNDSLVEQRMGTLYDLSRMVGRDREEMIKAYLQGINHVSACSCGDCPQCDVNDGEGLVVAIRQPASGSDLISILGGIICLLGGAEDKTNMVAVMRRPDTTHQMGGEGVMIRRGQHPIKGKLAEIMVAVVADSETIANPDAEVSVAVREQIEALLRQIDGS